jgi:D-inositol-3-phosphate glycosyltransferase
MADLARSPVLIVSAYSLPHLGGVEVVVAQQARTLVELGHRVTVVSARAAPATAARERVDGYEIVRIPAWNKLEERRGIALPIWSPAALWRLGALVRRSAEVHVHDVYHPQSLVAAVWARLLRRPLFVTQHVAIVDHDQAVVGLVQRLLYATVARLLWRQAVVITVYNPIVEDFIRAYGVPAAKLRRVGNGVDTSQFRPGDPASARATRTAFGLAPDLPVVLFVGRLVPKKGFDQLVAARGPEYQIVLAGPGAIPADVPAGVTFLGPVPRDELLGLYQASDLFALPATGEMLTLAMQEAMACGLPVITTAEDGYDQYELDPEGVALVQPEPGPLRSAILGLLGDPRRRQHMRSYSRQLAVERFDWRRNAATAEVPP